MIEQTRTFKPEHLQPPPGFDPTGLAAFLRSGMPLDLEIGCGVGWHPIQYAKKNPDRNLIALERTRAKFDRFRGRLEGQEPISNLYPVHADAVPFLVHAFPEPHPVFQNVFILYPNPSPKNPAERWIRRPFFAYLVQRMRPGGRIHFASNSLEYLREVERYSPLATSELLAVSGVSGFRTHFEKKYLDRGEPCWDLVLTRGEE